MPQIDLKERKRGEHYNNRSFFPIPCDERIAFPCDTFSFHELPHSPPSTFLRMLWFTLRRQWQASFMATPRNTDVGISIWLCISNWLMPFSHGCDKIANNASDDRRGKSSSSLCPDLLELSRRLKLWSSVKLCVSGKRMQRWFLWLTLRWTQRIKESSATKPGRITILYNLFQRGYVRSRWT